MNDRCSDCRGHEVGTVGGGWSGSIQLEMEADGRARQAWERRSVPWMPVPAHWIQERAQQTRLSMAVGGRFRGPLGSRGIAAGQGGYPQDCRLSSDASPCSQGTEASGEWGRLSAMCPLECASQPAVAAHSRDANAM